MGTPIALCKVNTYNKKPEGTVYHKIFDKNLAKAPFVTAFLDWYTQRCSSVSTLSLCVSCENKVGELFAYFVIFTEMLNKLTRIKIWQRRKLC